MKVRVETNGAVAQKHVWISRKTILFAAAFFDERTGPIFDHCFNIYAMLDRLRQHWKLSPKDFVLVLCVFAVTGTTTAYVSKAVTGWAGFTEATHWGWKLLLRLAVLVFGYQAVLLTVAFLFGQFPFFWKFEKRILQRMGILKKEKKATIKKTV